MDPAKLKVVELRQELQTRGLDTKGVKAVLVDRLRSALEAEGAAIRDQVLGLSPTKSDGHVSQEDSAAEEELAVEPEPEPEPFVDAPVVEEPAHVFIEDNVAIAIEDSSTVDEVAEEPTYDVDSSQAPATLTETQPMEEVPVSSTLNQTSHLSSATEESVSASATNASTEDVEMSSVVERSVPPPIDEENDNAADVPEEKAAESEAVEEEAMEVTDAPKNDDTPADDASQETTPADDLAAATTKASEEAAAKKAEEEKKDGDSRKRKRSRSPSPKRRTRTNSTAANTDDFTSVEDEPEIDADKVTLSWFDSDLQLRISSTDFCDARPISDAAFGLVWAGARATHGVRVGQKVCYEVQLAQKNSRVNFEQEKNLFNLRCGWSVQNSDLHLGDAPLSFGFDGEGKKVRGGAAEDYGRAFEVDDVVGVYLDLQSEPCTIEYTLNGESLGVAFEFAQEELGEAALFPHIMSKNLSFKVNFGQLEQNLLTDLKAKPKKKKQEEVKPAETENEKVVDEKEEKEPEAKTEVETTEPLEGEKVEKEGEEEATPTAAQEEEKPAEEVTESAPETVAEEEQSKPEEQETKDAEIEAAPAADVPSEDVDMAVAEEEKKEGEEEAETEATTKPAEEVKEVVEEEKEEDEPLPEINRENLPGFIFIGLVEKEQLVAGPLRPESRKECEVIMMIGLSGAGKTKWVQDFVAEHPEKGYIVLGASALIDRMKNPNLGRKIESSGRRQRLSELCTRSLGALQDIAQKRRKNYILDQPNVFASVQRRKMKGFGEFRRVAVIVVPTDEEYTRRQESCKNDIDKDNSETELNEMKANFVLPTMDLGWFDEIKYTELEEAEATKLVEDYNAKGKKALPPPAKKRPNNDYRNDNRRRDFSNRDRNYSRWDNRRGGNGGGGGGGGGYDNRAGDRWGGQRSGGGHPYHGSGGGGNGGGAGGYRRYDDRRQDRWGGGGGGSGGSAGSGGNWMNNNRRDFRSGGGHGGGGGGGGRSDYGSRDSHRDQHRNQYSSSSSRDYHSSSSSSSYRKNDGRDQDFRERRRDDGGITNRRYEAPRTGGAGVAGGRPDYHKRDNGSAKATDMMGNGGAAASQWNNAANWQQQLQWSNWQQGAGGGGGQAAAAQPDWNQGWATALQQQGWQSGTASGGWGQPAAATNSSSSSAGQWKSYGGSTTGSTGTASGSGASGQAAGSHWNGQQWTGGSY